MDYGNGFNDEDEEVDNEEQGQEQGQEQKQPSQQSVQKSNPISSASNQAVSGIKNKAKHAAKEGAKKAAKVVGAALRKLFMILVASPIFWIVLIGLIIIIAIVCWALSRQSSDTVTKSVDKQIESSAETMDTTLKSEYDNKKSLLSVNLSQIDDMFNKFKETNSNYDKNTISDLQKQYSGGDDKNPAKEGAVYANESRELYKHILLTEKYNFNNIEWKEYSHSKTGTEPTMEVNRENGLRFPAPKDDTEKKYNMEFFTKMTYPYLQNWYIPLSMYSGSHSSPDIEKSRKNGEFAYQIISKAYSDILINKFVVQTKTQVWESKNYDVTTVPIYGTIICTSQADNGPLPDTNMSCKILGTRKGDPSTDGVTRNVNVPDKMLSEKIVETTSYKFIHAMTFDKAFEYTYKYTKYGEEPNSAPRVVTPINDTPGGRDSYDSSIVYTDGVVAGDSGIYISQGEANFKYGIFSAGTYDKVVGHYSIRKGNKYTTTKIWKDELEQVPTPKADRTYTVSDITDFINNKKFSDTTISGTAQGGSSLTKEQIDAATKDYVLELSVGQKLNLAGKKVFIHPSIQRAAPREAGSLDKSAATSPWAVDNSTIEGDYMQLILTPYIKAMLEKVGVKAYTYDYGESYRGNWDTSSQINSRGGQVPDDVAAFVSLHSNDGGGKGQLFITRPGDAQDKRLGQYVSTAVNNAYKKHNGDNGIQEMERDDREVNYDDNIPRAILEIAYHDNLEDSKWMKENPEEIAKAVTNGIIGYILDTNITNKDSPATNPNDKKDPNANKKDNNFYWPVPSQIGSGYKKIYGLTDGDDEYHSDGAINSWYGWRDSTMSDHSGIDVGTQGSNLEIAASRAGTVTKAVPDNGAFANCVVIDHGDGYETLYGHLASYNVSEGQSVEAGQIIGIMGGSGLSGPNTYAVHLHFNIYLNGDTVDPSPFFNEDFSPSGGGPATAPGGGNSGPKGEKLSEQALEYYKRLEDQKKLDRLDFINATKSIYNKYVVKNQQFADNIGRPRGYLDMSYSLLKLKLSSIGKDPDNLPFVYGQSLGLNKNHKVSMGGSGSGLKGNLIWPVDLDDSHANGDSTAVKISSIWGYQDDRVGIAVQVDHPALDIVSTCGKSPDIIASTSGTVVDSWPGVGAVTIKSDDGKYLLQYMHMEPPAVSVGDHVEQGQVVGTMGGAGGYPTHLHFAVATDRNGDGTINEDMDTESVDPAQFYQIEGAGTLAGTEYPYGDDDRRAPWRAVYTDVGGNVYFYAGLRSVGGDHPVIEGEGVERWRPYVVEALAEVRANTGLDIPQDEDMVTRTLQQMHNESSGIVDAINREDSNSGFDCSVGLLQLIASTFNVNKREQSPPAVAISASESIVPEDGRLQPYECIYAGINYAAHKYGPTIPNWPGGGY